MDFRSWCLHYFPGGTFTDSGDHYSCKNHFRGEKNDSLSFWNSGRGWKDFGTNEHGKISDFCREHGLPEWDGAPEHREEKKILPASNDKASEARRLWEQAKDAINHPYLTKKKIDGQGCRVTADGTLLVPAYNVSGDLVGVERIDAAGNKRHLGNKGGAFFPCGDLDAGKTVLVCEGMATTKSLNAITNFPTLAAFGSINLLGAAQALQGKDVLICPDTDEAGRKAATQCRSAGFKVVELPPESRNGLDWNDVHVEHGIEPAKALFREAWSKATVKQPETPKKSILDIVKAPSPGTARKPEKVWHFPRKHLNLVAADPGMGKSILITKVSADLSIAAPVLGMNAEPIRKTLYLNGECGSDYFDWRFKSSDWQYSEDYFKVVHQEDAAEEGIDLDLDTPQGRKNLELLLEKHAPDLFVIDSLPAFSDEDMNDGQSQNTLCKYLKQLAIRYNLALVLITHLRKRRFQDQGTEPTLSEIQGSNAGAKQCNVALVVYESKIEVEDEERVIKVCKSVKSWGPKVLPFGFSFPEMNDDELVMQMEEIPKKQKHLQGAWERVKTALQYTEFSRQAVEDLLGISDRTAKSLLSDWQQQGKIERIGRGKNTVYLVSKGQSVNKVHMSSPNQEKPVIPTNDTGTLIFTESEPQEGNHSVKNSFTESKPVISMDDEESVKNIEGASPNEEGSKDDTVKRHPKGNLEPFFPCGLKTGLSIPRGPSLSELASRAGVSEGAVLEELSRWEECKRVKVEDDHIIILAGTSYPEKDEPEPPEESPAIEPNEPPSAGPGQGGLFPDETDAEPLSLDALEAWAVSISPGMTGRIRARARREKASYEALLRQEYASSMEGEQETKEGVRLPAPSEKKYVSMKDVTLSDALAWAAGVPGLVQRLKEKAEREHDPVMERSPRALYESLVRIEYADHLQKELDAPDLSGQGEKEPARKSYMDIFTGGDDEEG
ncbi:MAG: AAA family ATPase [Aminivibrio sp.]|uniref:AAA family ATPase n=1 Tax=Aminivibrio sp. TaxID=1872489 RepID=UPI002B21919E|nr:AAA family ATPase [Aminivibrio sp.]MEA4952725.1 AAA family ATPase [Aminivibrio sp.]